MSAAHAIRSALLEGSGAAHAFFTRRGGVSQGVYATLNGGVGSRDLPELVAENRRRMAQALGVPPHCLLIPYQVHSTTAIAVDAPWAAQQRPHCDGLATATSGLALGVTGADCGMILFHDGSRGVIGAAHAGWKGALNGVLETTVERMEELGALRKNIVAALGPTIARQSYEVGPEFVERFEAADPQSAPFFDRSAAGARAHFDLPSYIGERLRRFGLGEFEDLSLDTYRDEERLFSYRRSIHRGEPDYGRLVAAITLR